MWRSSGALGAAPLDEMPRSSSGVARVMAALAGRCGTPLSREPVMRNACRIKGRRLLSAAGASARAGGLGDRRERPYQGEWAMPTVKLWGEAPVSGYQPQRRS